MKELVRFIVAALVDHPEHVRVTETAGDRSVVVELSVHPEDLGRVIGRQGKTASALRALLGAAAVKTRQRVLLEILEEDEGRARAEGSATPEGEDDGPDEAAGETGGLDQPAATPES